MRRKKVLLLFDVTSNSVNSNDGFKKYLQHPDWRDEKHLTSSLVRLGHQVSHLGIFDQIAPVFEHIRLNKPDIIFNCVESFATSRNKAAGVTSILDLSGIPYTGVAAESLALCQDKLIAKKLMLHQAVRTPRFVLLSAAEKPKHMPDLTYPLLVKPLAQEGSEGITQRSLIRSPESLVNQLENLQIQLKCDILVEEFIEGRELYIGMLGNDKPEALNPVELVFSGKQHKEKQFATFRSKWDDKYRQKWGIKTQKSKPLADKLKQGIKDMVDAAFHALKIRGYGRLDVRVDKHDNIYFLEANPNPSIARDDELAKAALASGLSYDQLIGKIVQLAEERKAS